MKDVVSFDDFIKGNQKSTPVEEEMIGSPSVDKVAKSMGLDVKKGQLAAAGKIESKLLDIVKEVEKQLGIELEITAGNDHYHHSKKKEANAAGKSYNSKHVTGDAIDFVSKDRRLFNNDKQLRLKTEKIIANIIKSKKYEFSGKHLGAINEYDNPSKHSTAGHFHIDIRKNAPYINLALTGINSVSDLEKSDVSTSTKTSTKVSPKAVKIAKKYKRTRFKIWDKKNRTMTIAKFKVSKLRPNGYFKLYNRRYDRIGEATIENGKVILKNKYSGKDDITSTRVGSALIKIFNSLTTSGSAPKSKTINLSGGNITHSYSGDKAKNIEMIKNEAAAMGITNPMSVVAILGVIGKESQFIPKSENLNYSKNRLPEVWGAFSTTGSRVAKGQGATYANDLASEYANNPEKLANFVYSNKYGNGDESSGDGFKYRGRGFNQITFKSTYEKYSKILGMDIASNPDLLNDPKIAAKAAIAFLLNGLKQKSIDPNSFKTQKEAIDAFASANAGWNKDATVAIRNTENAANNFSIA